MRQHSNLAKDMAEKVVKDIRRATRKQYSAEEKIRIVLEGLRGEDSIAELCRREGIAQNLYYRWSKDFLEAGKKRLAGDTARPMEFPALSSSAGSALACSCSRWDSSRTSSFACVIVTKSYRGYIPMEIARGQGVPQNAKHIYLKNQRFLASI